MRWRRRSARSAKCSARRTSSSPASRRSTATPRRSAPASPSGSICLQLTYVSKIVECDPATARDHRSSAAPKAACSVLKTQLPCLITMLEGSNVVRRGTMNDALRAARAEIVTWSAKDAGIEDSPNAGSRARRPSSRKSSRRRRAPERAIVWSSRARPRRQAAESHDRHDLFKRQPALEQDLIEIGCRILRRPP